MDATLGKKKSFWRRLLDWRMEGYEALDQVEHYDTLKWTKSYRKLSAALLLLSVALSAITAPLFKQHPSDVIPDAVLYGALAVFAYRGHRWSFIAAMAVWTADKIFQVMRPGPVQISGPMFFSVFLWWAAYMQVFFKAFNVERHRRKPPLPAQRMAA